jgi:hypothetical protein
MGFFCLDLCQETKPATTNHNKPLQNFSIDLRLMEKPTYDREYILFALNGEVFYKNISANVSTIKPILIDHLPKPPKMVRQIINEHVWNTFFYHLFEQKLISFDEKFHITSLPVVVRFPLQSVCWNCHLKIQLFLQRPPVMQINSNGMKIHSKLQIDLLASGFLYEAHIMDGEADLVSALILNITDDQVFANLTIENIKVDVGKTGLATYMPATFAEAIREWIKERVWPLMKTLTEEAFAKISLSNGCRLKFSDLELIYVNGASVFDADFDYDVGNVQI